MPDVNDFSSDLIVAPATANGYAGLAIIRLSGSGCLTVLSRVFVSSSTVTEWKPNWSYLGWLQDPGSGQRLDEVRVLYFQAPHSYTGEDLIEITTHGNPYLVQRITGLFLNLGGRLARPGEFTRRALLNHKLDLLQAEAVSDMIQAVGDESHQLAVSQYEGRLSATIRSIQEELTGIVTRVETAIDFPEEDDIPQDQEDWADRLRQVNQQLTILLASARTGIKIRTGYRVLLLGRANVGKSTLFNQLVGYDRALVHETPGTTRDHLDETIQCGGLCIHLYDTAGILPAATGADKIAADRTLRLVEDADLLLLLFDGSEPLNEHDLRLVEVTARRPRLFVVNKIDINPRFAGAGFLSDAVKISAKTGLQVDVLKTQIAHTLKPSVTREQPLLNRLRHEESARAAQANVTRALSCLDQYELAAYELHEAIDHLGEITGRVLRQDILNRIFNEFCVGK